MSKPKKRNAGDDLRRLIQERMESCQTAEALNDRVILPFVQALEAVCGARGYVLNIYGEQSNLVFTGDEDASEEIYALIESFLDSQAETAADDA
ncbi:MAG TPA: hypothetical protein DCG48_02950 [Rhodospirillaceae bacterium]|nr:hypothetical protein [Rhodospirillaceae bacterium]|tara:strand:+ start:1083 stop:1364 length:282 start_codon:yes stop_codon:yes gene_type:complete